MPFDEKHFAEVNEEVQRHLEDTETSKLGHWRAAQVYENYHKLWLGLPATLFSIILAWLISSQTTTIPESNPWKTFFLFQLPVFLSLVVSLLSGLTAFLNLNETASRHRNAAESLHALWRDCKNWATDFPDFSQCEAAVKRVQIYRQRLNEINRDAPQIPKWAWKNVQKQRQEGSVSYNAEQPERNLEK